MPLKLILANKAYSSWSLRPWILLAQLKIPFEEVVIPMDQPETRASMLKYAPTGKCPSLQDGKIVIWESLAIIEYLARSIPKRRYGRKAKPLAPTPARSPAKCTRGSSRCGRRAQRIFAGLSRRSRSTMRSRRTPRALKPPGRMRARPSAGRTLSVWALFRGRRDVRARGQPLSCLRRPCVDARARLYGGDHGSPGVEGLDRRCACRTLADRTL